MTINRDPADLSPWLAYGCGQVEVRMAALGHPVVLWEGLRELERQAQLYAKGRTKPGIPCRHDGIRLPIGMCMEHELGLRVTNAEPGESDHNPPDDGAKYSNAADYAFAGKDPWGEDHPWDLFGQVAEDAGLKWGGRWPSKDLGHVYID